VDRWIAVVGCFEPPARPELTMTLPRTVAEILADHVNFEVECIDRMYLNVYVPSLQYAAGIVGYVHQRLGLPIASTAALAKITERFAGAIHRFAHSQQIPWVDFVKGQRKDEVMAEQLARFEAAGYRHGVVFIGRAQEKTPLFRTEKRRAADGHTYPWIVKSTGVVNHFYFYCLDADFGPFFLKFCSYFPYNAKLCFNGHHWAQRQARQAGIGFTAMDNAFAAVDDPAALQAICDRLGPEQIEALLRRWLKILPHPFGPADRAAGYRYDLSILQAEFSLTQMLDRPVTGRVFFEHVIRDNLDLGRPDQIGLIFDRHIQLRGRRATPGRFRTRVITAGVIPSLYVDYKSTTIKQYHKQGRALRTETTINDSHDFKIGKRLTNLPALREVGFTANRRLLGVQRLDHDPITGATALTMLTDPVTTPNGTRIPGLRLGQPRSHALLAALLTFRLHADGFTNHELRILTAQLRRVHPHTVTAGQITYDLRRLRMHQLIARVPHTHRYQVTETGLRTAMLITRIHDRLLPTGLGDLAEPNTPGPLRRAFRTYQQEIDRLANQCKLAATPHKT
jgi:hypothetical protein